MCYIIYGQGKYILIKFNFGGKKMRLTLKWAERMMRKNNGNLDLGNTTIKDLPEGLVVGGNLYLYNSSIDCLPESLALGGCICGKKFGYFTVYVVTRWRLRAWQILVCR